MKRVLVFACVCATVGLMAGVAQRDLWVNGKKAEQLVIEHEGEIYISATALRENGAEVTVTDERVGVQFIPMKGQDQLDAIEGIIGEFVSNAGWRIKVHEVTSATNPFTNRGPGYRVRIEVRNLSERNISMHNTGLNVVQLIDNEGRVLSPTDRSFSDRYTALPPGGHFINELVFGDPRGEMTTVGPADKLLITFRAYGGTTLKNIRIFLNPEQAAPGRH